MKLYATIDLFSNYVSSLNKQAGYIQVPSDLLKKVQDWCIACFSNDVIKELKRRNESNPFLYGMMKSNLKGYDLDFEDGEYYQDFIYDMSESKYYIDKLAMVKIQCCYSEYNDSGHAGEWIEDQTFGLDANGINLGELVISSVDLSGQELLENKILDFIHQLKEVTEHELIHAMQSYLNIVPQPSAGIPSKKMQQNQLDYDEDDLELYSDEVTNKDYGDVIHPLRDVEFYTRLKDEINRFNKLKQLLPKQLVKLYAKLFVDGLHEKEFPDTIFEFLSTLPNDKERKQTLDFLKKHEPKNYTDLEFFRMLKKYQPKKYEKACKEFFKAVF